MAVMVSSSLSKLLRLAASMLVIFFPYVIRVDFFIRDGFNEVRTLSVDAGMAFENFFTALLVSINLELPLNAGSVFWNAFANDPIFIFDVIFARSSPAPAALDNPLKAGVTFEAVLPAFIKFPTSLAETIVLLYNT